MMYLAHLLQNASESTPLPFRPPRFNFSPKSSAQNRRSQEHIPMRQEMYGRWQFGIRSRWLSGCSATSAPAMSSYTGCSSRPCHQIPGPASPLLQPCFWPFSFLCSSRCYSQAIPPRSKTPRSSRKRSCTSMTQNTSDRGLNRFIAM